MINTRQLAYDLMRLGNKIALYSGILSHKSGAFAIKMERWYYRLTERERG